MDKAAAPMDMLRKCRAHFAKEAEEFRKAAVISGTVWERRAASSLAEKANEFVSNIDATLRDWA